MKRRGTLITNYIGKESNDERPIDSYKEKFKNTYKEVRESLHNIRGNIRNYTNEISRLEDFLGIINEHENNYKNIIEKFNNLKKKLEETIQMETIIRNLSSNQYYKILNSKNLYSIFKIKCRIQYK